MQQHLHFETRLDLESSTSEKLQRLVNKSASDKNLISPMPLKEQELIWSSDYFGLNQVQLFQDLSEELKFRILKKLNQSVLTEIYFIERCGMYYAAKMALLAESIEERALYNMMSSEETLHYLWISEITGPIDALAFQDQPFLKFLNGILETEEKNVLIAVVQILLEGWGLRHYKKLAEYSLHSGATEIFSQIVKDEASHHGGGLILFDPAKQTAETHQRLTDILNYFFDLVRSGPQMICAVFQSELGVLTLQQKIQLFAELNAEEETQKNLNFLKSLLQTAKIPQETLDALESKECFKSFTVQKCAEI